MVGTGNAYMNWQLAGPNATFYPARVTLSSSTTDMVGSISLLNGSQAGTGGTLLKGPFICCTPEWNRPHGPNQQYAWPADRKIITRDDTAWDHNGVVEFSWTIPGYPGVLVHVGPQRGVTHDDEELRKQLDLPVRAGEQRDTEPP